MAAELQGLCWAERGCQGLTRQQGLWAVQSLLEGAGSKAATIIVQRSGSSDLILQTFKRLWESGSA